jgi:twitching motility protein PilT
MEFEIDAALRYVVEHEGSDLHLKVDSPPMARVHGALRPIEGSATLTAGDTEKMLHSVADERHLTEFEQEGEVDLSYEVPKLARFRVSAFRQRGAVSMAFRTIPYQIRTVGDLGLPDVVRRLAEQPRGIILLTGTTGSGKSTTLAAMVDWINEHLDRHIVTIEDPVEYLHHSRRSLVTQREVGSDVPSFAEAMRRVLRQDPDVIMVGEMRDLETIATATTAAETGHLVLGTLHTTGSAKTVSRIIDVFPPNQQEQIRVQLAMSLLAVISQVLVPAREGATGRDGRPLPARVAALEVMCTTPAVSNLIRNNEIMRMQDVIQTSRDRGMFTLDDHLALLVRRGVIDRAVALAYCLDPRLFESRMH